MRRTILLILACVTMIGAMALTREEARRAFALDTAAVGAMRRGEFTKAMSSLNSLLEMPIAPNSRAIALRNLGICYRNLGEFSRAAAVTSQALGLCGSDKAMADSIGFSLASTQVLSGQYDDAIHTLAGVEGDSYRGRRQAALAHAYFRRGRDGDTHLALQLIDSALIYETAPRARAIALQNRGYIHWTLGNLDSAAEDLAQALELHADGADWAVTMANLAEVEADRHNYERALALIDGAMQWQKAHLGPLANDYLISQRKRADILLKAGRRSDASHQYRQFFDVERENILTQMEPMSQQQRLNFWKMKKPLVSEIFRLGDSDASLLYDVALYRRHLTLAQHNLDQLRRVASCGVAQVRDALNAGEMAMEIVNYYDDNRADTVYAALCVTPGEKKPRIVDLWTQRELYNYDECGKPLIEAVLSVESNDKDNIYTDETLAQMVWDPIFKALPRGVKRIIFAPDGLLQMLAIEYLPYKKLEGVKLSRVSSTAKVLERGRPRKAANDSTLVIGGMDFNRVPSTSGSASADNHEAADFLLKKLSDKRWFPFLTGSVAEVRHIDTIMPKSAVVVEISEPELAAILPRYGSVHFSTHGYALPIVESRVPVMLRDSVTEDKSMIACGLALSGANEAHRSPGADELLSAKEISALDLSGLDLVVLSACQSAIGNTSDEGPAGMVRGLKKAGANTVIATLWPINDQVTTKLINRFYSSRAKGMGVSDALAEAQAYLRSLPDPPGPVMMFTGSLTSQLVEVDDPITPYDSPYFWAPFIVIDDLD